MIWALDALQSDHPGPAFDFIDAPADAATTDITSRFAIHKWELETLVTLFLRTPQSQQKKDLYRTVNIRNFEVSRRLINSLRAVENAEAARTLRKMHVFNEMHRVGQRQFPWQWGFGEKEHLIRYSFIYLNGESGCYLNEIYKSTNYNFILVGLIFFAAFQEKPIWNRGLSLEEFGIQNDDSEAFLARVETSIEKARRTAQRLWLARQPIAYQPSVLRRRPILQAQNDSQSIFAPLRRLLLERITSGLYYDIIESPERQTLINDASDRFERYVLKITQNAIPSFVIKCATRYRIGRFNFDTPDLLVFHHNELILVIECKITKLTLPAQFSENPIKEAEQAYDQMAKGAYQIWRFLSHLRRGLTPFDSPSKRPLGVVLTLEPWLVASPLLLDDVLMKSNKMSDDNGEILDADRSPAIFCPIHHWEQATLRSDADSLIDLIGTNTTDRYKGYVLPALQDELGHAPQKAFPIEPSDVLPFWEKIKAIGWKITS